MWDVRYLEYKIYKKKNQNLKFLCKQSAHQVKHSLSRIKINELSNLVYIDN